MEFSNRYYATLLSNNKEKAQEYLEKCQNNGVIREDTVVEDAEELQMMTDYLRSKGIKVRPNFKPETIKTKYKEAKEQDL